MKRWFKILLFCLTCLTLISWDKATKDLAKEHLKGRETRSYFHDTFRLQYVENTGAAMSLGDDLPRPVSFWVLSILPFLFLSCLFLYVLSRAKKFSFLQLLAFASIIAGGFGNIFDRLMYDRHVTDFMNVGFNNLRTGIFNLADVCVTIGVLGLTLLTSKKQPAFQQTQ